MEEMIGGFFFFLYAAFFIISAILLVYFAIKRIKNKGKEDFEQRDN